MTQNNQKGDSPNNWDLEKLTKVILIIGIILVSGGIIYLTTRPGEPDLQFFLLNEDQMLKNYPTNTTSHSNITLYAFVQNSLLVDKNFLIKCYKGNAENDIDPETGVANDSAYFLVSSQDKFLKDGQDWISDPFTVTLSEVNTTQRIVFELWQQEENGWIYLENYILTLNIQIFP